MPIRGRTTLLLDLDGTLVDPAEGIIGGYRHALSSLGVPAAEDDDLRWVIGPSMRESFGQLLAGRGDIDSAVQLYRDHYRETGLYQAKRYSGVRKALAAHRERGARLILCTAKPHIFARRVTDHFELSSLLDAVYGPELDGRHDDKGDLIDHLLREERLDPSEVCMVGDRKHDVLAASRHGIPTVGVLWGYGSREELETAGAALLVETPAGLLPPPAA